VNIVHGEKHVTYRNVAAVSKPDSYDEEKFPSVRLSNAFFSMFHELRRDSAHVEMGTIYP